MPRIISLLPSATEIVCALGLREDLVAVSHECDFPAGVSELPQVTHSILQHGLSPAEIDAAVTDSVRSGVPIYGLDPDALGTLRPDLVITQSVCNVCAVGEEVARESLTRIPAGPGEVEILSLTAGSVDGILRDIVRVGEVTGTSPAARQVALNVQARINAVRALPAPPRRTRTLVLEWSDPPYTAGHWVPELVAASGGVDVLAAPGERSRRFEWHEALEARPEVVVMAACGYGLDRNVELLKQVMSGPLAALEARFFAVDANSYFSRPGPRVCRGAELRAAALGREGAPLAGEGELREVARP